MKILFLAAHRPNRSPSQRFRFEQYFDFLKENGIKYDFSYLLSAWDDRNFYSKGNYLIKFWIVIKSFLKRWRDTARANKYDIIFIQREAFMLGTTFFERRIAKSRAKMIFDFDDAIWKMDVSKGNEQLKFLKNPNKTAKLIAMSDMVFAGNKYLTDYAKKYNPAVFILPTTIDTTEYKPVERMIKQKPICIGWSGSKTTIKHFESALPFLKEIKNKYGDRVIFKIIGDGSFRSKELDTVGIDWNKEEELKQLQTIDIGIMPLPNDEWSKGKCGLKGLQYMALAIPTIMSPVGVNSEIIQHGKNGFLAATDKKWIQIIEQLLASAELREEIGKEGRKTVIKEFSVEANKDLYLKLFDKAAIK